MSDAAKLGHSYTFTIVCKLHSTINVIYTLWFENNTATRLA